MRDTSLKVPHGEYGIVVDTKTFTRENGAVMVLDRESYLSEQHDATLIALMKPGYEW